MYNAQLVVTCSDDSSVIWEIEALATATAGLIDTVAIWPRGVIMWPLVELRVVKSDRFEDDARVLRSG